MNFIAPPFYNIVHSLHIHVHTDKIRVLVHTSISACNMYVSDMIAQY